MGVKFREKVQSCGEWWAFINHHGKHIGGKVDHRRHP
jgi:hypothetical protein